MTAIYIGLTVIAFLAAWDSHLLRFLVRDLEGAARRLDWPGLAYFLRCHTCKGFWLSMIGGWIAGNVLLGLPAFGIVVFFLAVKGDYNDDQDPEISSD